MSQIETKKINGDEFYKEFKLQERRAYELIKILKSKNKSKVSYMLNRTFEIVNGEVIIKIKVQELPVLRIKDSFTSDDDDDYFGIQEIENID